MASAGPGNRPAPKTPGNLPLSAEVGLAESMARMGTGGATREISGAGGRAHRGGGGECRAARHAQASRPAHSTRGTPFRRDFGLPAAPLTHLAVAAALDRYPPAALGFATTTLQRSLNHVLAAIEAADLALPAV